MACWFPRPGWLNLRSGGQALMQFPVGEDPLDWRQVVLVCRRCSGCRASRARDISIRTAHEAQIVGEASFLTLTYDRAHMPWHTSPATEAGRRQALLHPGRVLPFTGSLKRADLVLFMKRLRFDLSKREGKRVRGYSVGEYGGRSGRAHYHICLLGHDFRSDRVHAGKSKHGHAMYTSARLEALWGMGMCWINEMGQEVAQYAAKYAVKAQGGALELRMSGEHLVQVEAPFDSLPLGKAMGRPWLDRYWSDVFPRGEVVLKGGVKLPAPAAYMRVLLERDPEAHERIAVQRSIDGLARFADFMPDRLDARRINAEARAAQSERDAV